MWSSWDAGNLWSRIKRFAILGAVTFGFTGLMVGAYFGLRGWSWFSLGVLSRIEQSLSSWLVPVVAIAFGLIAALWTVRSVLSRETSRWRWLAIVFAPFWALQWIFWIGGVLLGLLLLIPLLPFSMWDEKHKTEVAKRRYIAFQKSEEMRERARSEYMAAIRQKVADEYAANEKRREEAPIRTEQTRLRRLERSRSRRAAEKEARRIRQADKVMRGHLFAEIYRSAGFASRASRTQEVRLRVVSPETKVSPPSITLPVGDYLGYAETKDFDGEGVENLNLVVLFLDETTVGKLGLSGHKRPIKFEVLRHLSSGAIQLIEG